MISVLLLLTRTQTRNPHPHLKALQISLLSLDLRLSFKRLLIPKPLISRLSHPFFSSPSTKAGFPDIDLDFGLREDQVTRSPGPQPGCISYQFSCIEVIGYPEFFRRDQQVCEGC